MEFKTSFTGNGALNIQNPDKSDSALHPEETVKSASALQVRGWNCIALTRL